MSTLENFLLDHFGNYPKYMPTGKTVRFAASNKPHSKSCWVRNLGEIAFTDNFREPHDKCLIWRSDNYNQTISKMDQFNRTQYFEKLRIQQYEEQKKISAEKYAFIAEEWPKISNGCIENDYFIKKQCKVMADFKMEI